MDPEGPTRRGTPKDRKLLEENMRIVVSGHSLSANRQIRFWKYMALRGHEVLVLAPRDWMFHHVDDEDEGNFHLRGVTFIGRSRRIRGFFDLVRDFDPDVVILSDESDFGQFLQAFQLKMEMGFTLVSFHWDNVPHWYGWEKGIKVIDLFVAGCEGAKRVLTREKRVFEDKVVSPIPQVGIDTSLFHPLDVEKVYDTVYVGGMTVNKGVDLIEEVVRRLGIHHLWIGARRGYDVLPYEGFPVYGDYRGWIDYEELPEWYNRAHVFVIASRDTRHWKEQWGYAIGEALSCGLPAVISNAGEFPSVWGPCRAVRMFEQGDVDDLHEKLDELLNDDPSEIGREGRRFVESRYSMEVVARKYEEVFG